MVLRLFHILLHPFIRLFVFVSPHAELFRFLNRITTDNTGASSTKPLQFNKSTLHLFWKSGIRFTKGNLTTCSSLSSASTSSRKSIVQASESALLGFIRYERQMPCRAVPPRTLPNPAVPPNGFHVVLVGPAMTAESYPAARVPVAHRRALLASAQLSTGAESRCGSIFSLTELLDTKVVAHSASSIPNKMLYTSKRRRLGNERVEKVVAGLLQNGRWP
ncbi:hypothetical protein KC351_g16 [Hortaea werneckii]|nr:hypothetical protein KC351_g16 [Hortaea werneckii]